MAAALEDAPFTFHCRSFSALALPGSESAFGSERRLTPELRTGLRARDEVLGPGEL